MTGPLAPHLLPRPDFEALIALGQLFDEAVAALRPAMVELRAHLENDAALVIPVDADFDAVCRNVFDADMDGGLASARLISQISVRIQLERLFDFFKLRRSGRGDALRNPACILAIQTLMLSEALALCLAGVAKVSHEGQRFDLSARDGRASRSLRNTWFARSTDALCHEGTQVLAQKLADGGAEHVDELDRLTLRLMDRDLSLPWLQMDEGRRLNSVLQIRAATELVAVLTVLGIRAQPLGMNRRDLSRHGLDFDTVMGLLRRQADALVTDRFLERQGDHLSLRFEASSKGLRQLFRVLELEFGERSALQRHAGGKFFELTYIRERIASGQDYLPRYRILDGFDRHGVIGDIDNQCDIEFILHDTEQAHYYFIQAKHALLGEKAFFEAMVEAVQGDLGYGLNQLREAKRLLGEGLLHRTLAERGITDAHPGNCSFVLLHNIAQFDFQEVDDGLSMYDWATFRNLLKDAEYSDDGPDGPTQRLRLPTPLVITSPSAVIHRLLTEHPAFGAGRATGVRWAQEEASTSIDLLGRTVNLRGLGL